MTLQETINAVMKTLTVLYPAVYAKMSVADKAAAAAVWAAAFAEDDVRLVVAAVKSFVMGDEKGFPPVPGQIRAEMRRLTGRKELTAAEAWGLVRKATPKVGVRGGAEAEFGKLPPLVQAVVGSPKTLREWGNTDTDTLNSVIASNFRRDYREALEKAEAERKYAALTPNERRLIDGQADSPAALPAGNPPWEEG